MFLTNFPPTPSIPSGQTQKAVIKSVIKTYIETKDQSKWEIKPLPTRKTASAYMVPATLTIDQDDGDNAITHDPNNNYIISNYWSRLECDDLFTQQCPIHPQLVWLNVRRTYMNIIWPERSTISNQKSLGNPFFTGYSDGAGKQESGEGYLYERDNTGRSADVQFRQTAQSQNSWDYRRFIMDLSVNVVYNIFQWAYIQYIDPPKEENDDDDGLLHIMVDLDKCTFCNSCNNNEQVNKAILSYCVQVRFSVQNCSDF